MIAVFAVAAVIGWPSLTFRLWTGPATVFQAHATCLAIPISTPVYGIVINIVSENDDFAEFWS